MVIAHTVLSRVYGEDPEGILNFTQGRSAILFATVAGVSLALMSGGRRRLDGTELMQARLAILGPGRCLSRSSRRVARCDRLP